MALSDTPLEPIGALPPVAWLHAPETVAVIDALSAEGTEVRFVGGCVRDALNHGVTDAADIDIATPDKPEKVMDLLRQAGIQAIPTGIDHGTITAIVDSKAFEITTLRMDLQTDGRRAIVGFTDDWIEDAKRRDFTFNALSATPDGSVYDPFNGLWDLAHGQVRFIGSAHERIEEDYLRILRYFRFFGAFGRPPMDSDAIAACRAHAKNLKQLSSERIRNELFKILCVPDPAEIIIKMRGAEVLGEILPEAGDPGVLRMINWFETRAVNIEGIVPDPLRHLAALLKGHVQDVPALADRLRLSNKERDRLRDLCNPPVRIHPDMSDLAENRALRKVGPALFRDLVLLNWGQEMFDNPRLPSERKQSWIAQLERTTLWKSPVFPLTGKDALTLGIAAGPEVGRLLSYVEDWWEAGNYKASRQQCLDRLLDEAKRP